MGSKKPNRLTLLEIYDFPPWLHRSQGSLRRHSPWRVTATGDQSPIRIFLRDVSAVDRQGFQSFRFAEQQKLESGAIIATTALSPESSNVSRSA